MRSVNVWKPVTMAAVMATVLTACSGSARRAGAASASEKDPNALRGAVLNPPQPKPHFTLTDTHGRPFHFRRQTDGYVTLLFFGYTHCPDVCPIHMANIAAVLKQIAPDIADRVKVVFVTTDPARDSAARLRSWLDNFDPDFIGLRGAPDSVAALERKLGLAPAVIEQRDSSGGYTVGHAAYVLAFTPDNKERVLYGFGTRQVDWAHDLPKLVNGPWSGS